MKIMTTLLFNDDEFHTLTDYLSYSKIVKLNKDPVNIQFTPTKNMDFGNLVHYLLSGQNFEDKYFVMPSNGPTEKMLEVVNQYVLISELNEDESLDNDKLLISRVCVDYNNKLKDDTFLKQIHVFRDYINLRLYNKLKICVTDEEYSQACKIILAIQISPTTSFMFDTERYEIHNEVQFVSHTIFGKFKGIKDLVLIDKIQKTIQCIDLKVISKPYYEFEDSYYKYRYDVQQMIYNIDNVEKSIESELKPLPTMFLLAEKDLAHDPILFHMNGLSPEIDVCYKGETLMSINKMIENAKWYMENDVRFTKDVIENNFILKKEYACKRETE